MKPGSFSLKSRILIFYLMLGFMPLLTISYISYDIASKSISRMTGRQLTQLIERISQQTEASFQKAKDDIFQLSHNPEIQLSFLQFSYGQRMETLKERLAVYRTNSDTLEKIALFTADGEPVLTSPMENSGIEGVITPAEVRHAYQSDFSFHEHIMGGSRKLVFFKRVYDYEDEAKSLGLLVFVIPLGAFTDFIDHVDIANGMIKQVRDRNGVLIHEKRDESGEEYHVYRQYSTHVPGLGWDILIKIPERALLSDILTLRNTSLVFAIFIGSVAFIAAIMFVQRILTPVRQIIEGTKRFAEGDLDYRIHMNYGKEMRLLADSFDSMAENLQKRQNELVQANKLASLGLMSAGIAHELKNPLAAIKTSIQVIKRRVRTEASLQLADGILHEVDRLTKIVSDLLDFSKPGPANIAPYNIKKTVDYSLQLMDRDIKQKNIRVNNNAQDCTVMVDPAQMQQIVINLLLNALAAVSRDTGEIDIYVHDNVKEGKAALEIRDNGKGIAEDKLDKVFDPFFSMTVGGTGLGLSVVFTLLKQNSIEHEIESRENEGTTFRLYMNKKV